MCLFLYFLLFPAWSFPSNEWHTCGFIYNFWFTCKKDNVKVEKKSTLYLVQTTASGHLTSGLSWCEYTPPHANKVQFPKYHKTRRNQVWIEKCHMVMENRRTGVKKRLFCCSLYSPLKRPFRKKLNSSYIWQYILWDAHYINRSRSVFVQSVTAHIFNQEHSLRV